MIYLDVTSAVRSSLNAGVQRAVRGIYRYLQARDSNGICPVRWDFSRKHYARLSSRESTFLTEPFHERSRPVSIPGWLNGLTSAGALTDNWSRRTRGMPLATFLQPDDTLLIPDLCWDTRVRSWPKLAQLPGHKVAIFHDAMPLRIRGQANSKDELFAEYVQALSQLDLVICVSDEVEADLLHFWDLLGVKAKPTVVVPWPVPFTGKRPDHQPNPAAKRILYVARLRLRKNHLVLLQACERLWAEGLTFSLDLVGMADAFFDTSKILIRAARLRRRGRALRWQKHVSETDLSRAYQSCSFTVFPSQMEGFGFPIIESLWHRRPVICGCNGAIGEVAAGGGCLLIDQNNAVELAGAIRSVLTDEDVYHRLYAEAEARVFRTWDDYGRDLDAVLKPALAR